MYGIDLCDGCHNKIYAYDSMTKTLKDMQDSYLMEIDEASIQSAFLSEMRKVMKKFDVTMFDFDHNPHFWSPANDIHCDVCELLDLPEEDLDGIPHGGL